MDKSLLHNCDMQTWVTRGIPGFPEEAYQFAEGIVTEYYSTELRVSFWSIKGLPNGTIYLHSRERRFYLYIEPHQICLYLTDEIGNIVAWNRYTLNQSKEIRDKIRLHCGDTKQRLA